MPGSMEIAQAAMLRSIEEIGQAVGLTNDEIEPYGRYKAKVTPTRAGEGKTTTAVLLTEGPGAIGAANNLLAARESAAVNADVTATGRTVGRF
jgi:formate--tetrahydrofolate ligase